MHSNYFDSMILGIFNYGQGSTIAVEGTHRSALRVLVIKFARRLALCLGSWRALSLRMPAVAMPAEATRPQSDRCRQRDQRWVPGVVTRGTVGVRW